MLKKNIKRKKVVIFALSFILDALQFFSPTSWAAGVGTSGAQFLNIGAGARPVAMGNAYVGLSNDINGPQWNPAGLVLMSPDRQLMTSYTHWLEDIKYGYFGYGQLINKNSAFGSAIAYMDTGNITQTNLLGEEVGQFTSTDTLLLLTYARKIFDKLSLGLNLKIFQEKIEQEKTSSYAFDMGAIYNPYHNIYLGLAVQNIGPKIKFVKEKDPLPINIKAGGVCIFVEDVLLMTADANLQATEDKQLNGGVGLEYWLNKLIAIRVGYDTTHITDIDEFIGLTAGFGFDWTNINMNYAWVPYGILGDTHRISLGFKW